MKFDFKTILGIGLAIVGGRLLLAYMQRVFAGYIDLNILLVIGFPLFFGGLSLVFPRKKDRK